jgi:hypothetical protein
MRRRVRSLCKVGIGESAGNRADAASDQERVRESRGRPDR